MGRGYIHIHIYIYKWTLRLLDRISPVVGWFGESKAVNSSMGQSRLCKKELFRMFNLAGATVKSRSEFYCKCSHIIKPHVRKKTWLFVINYVEKLWCLENILIFWLFSGFTIWRVHYLCVFKNMYKLTRPN